MNHALTITEPDIIVWSTTITESFHSIISNICQRTILTIPNKDDKFVVSCDASSCGVVVREDGESPVAFYSRQLLPRENHKALVNLFDSAILNNRLWRWRIQLQDHDFNIVYRPGQDNHVPDALSRQGWDP